MQTISPINQKGRGGKTTPKRLINVKDYFLKKDFKINVVMYIIKSK